MVHINYGMPTNYILLCRAQMQLAVSSQDFQTVVHWETELQVQYRNIFLNLINIYLDSLVQQKIIDEPQRNAISKKYTTQLKEVEQDWNSKLQTAIQVSRRNRPNQGILVPDWLIPSHVT